MRAFAAWRLCTNSSRECRDDFELENSSRNANNLQLEDNRQLIETTQPMEEICISWVVSINWKSCFAFDATISPRRSQLLFFFQASAVSGILLLRFLPCRTGTDKVIAGLLLAF
ncbi:hypothetical protein HUU39_00150 [candidate division KSB1 bacterium]|nr:hypothetical protein [bacterium]NUM63679.1 hypothetical protein [candidate division KSB1 bacterium]